MLPRMGFNIFEDVLGMSDPFLGSPISQVFGGPPPEEVAAQRAREQGFELVAQPIGTGDQLIAGVDNTVLILGGGMALLLVVLLATR